MTVDTAADLGELPRIQALLTAIGPVAGAKIIDIGCGEGPIAKGLAAHGATVHGYDPFIKPTDWIDEGEGTYRLANGKADAIPEPDGSADVVLFIFSLHHVPKAKMQAAMAEARRLLKPGGKLLVAEPLAEGPGQYVSELFHDETVVRKDATEALAAYAKPIFSSEQVMHFSEARSWTNWDAFITQQKANQRFNDYPIEKVDNDEVRGRFEEVLSTTGGRFAQKIRVNLFE